MFRLKALSRIYVSILLLGAITLSGTVGYMLVEDYTVAEAFYMTVITVSTVGYGEIKPLSDAGRVFTSMLIIFTFGTFAFTLSAISSFIMGGEYKNYFNKLRLEKEIDQLQDHVIICGYGRVGKMASKSLSKHGQPFVILEKDEKKLSKLNDRDDILYVSGDATMDETLISAGLKRAKALITTLPDDAANLYTVLTARELNKGLTIITRASKPESVRKLRIAGADNVIMPDSVGGVHMASLVVNPDVQEFLDQIAIQGDAEINLEEVTFTDLPPDFQFKTLGELKERNSIGINIIGIKTETGEYSINPGPETQILPNTKFFVLGKPEQIRLFNRVMGIE